MRELSSRTSGRGFWSGARVFAASLSVLAIGLMAAPLHAQVLYGSIVGVVSDAQGSAIPAATVTVVNKGTNLTQETVTNANGEYTLSNLQPGQYDVNVNVAALLGLGNQDNSERESLACSQAFSLGKKH